ncbi:hypothetical protein Pcinc_036379 [Petrolisthes cinctipes]|uniref:Uncharacterized protein n=1 Tax=Petrolisthes cinctipes TaxID=88211 RepID=A0AAE1ENR1_PETCI|nr:hypothetical protein Pcinc_036379 [Petrolisthes cinctipes]
MTRHFTTGGRTDNAWHTLITGKAASRETRRKKIKKGPEKGREGGPEEREREGGRQGRRNDIVLTASVYSSGVASRLQWVSAITQVWRAALMALPTRRHALTFLPSNAAADPNPS